MMMTIHELVTVLNTREPEKDVFVTLFKSDGTGEMFDIEEVHDQNGHVQLEIYEEEAPSDEGSNGAVRHEDTQGTQDAAEAPEAAFLDFCERRGVTEQEKDLIWNAMAFICYDQVQSRHGPFYEAIRPLLAEGA
jgi:hypothetical protein